MSSITIHRGVVPLGGIVPIMSNLTGTHTIPATGTVDSSGWMYCDGSAIPAGNSVSGTAPNLTGERFLVGSTASGVTGGSNSITATHTHTSAAHTHTMGTHTHNMKHVHQWAYTSSFGSVQSPQTVQTNLTNWTTGGTTWSIRGDVASSAGAEDYNVVSSGSFSKKMYTGGAEGGSGSGDTALTGSTDPGDTNSTTPGSTGSGNLVINNRPLYMSVQYIIRVI